MTRTFRTDKNYKKTARDGEPWRGCGDKNCPWCISTRTNKKCKEYLKREEL
jgi:hypothetical protein